MFEIPECIVLARQIDRTFHGRSIRCEQLGNSPHKFVWYNRSHDEFTFLTAGKRVGEAHARGRWIFIALEPGYVLVFGELGGKLIYHSSLSALTHMWGAMELYEAGKEQERQYIKEMRPTPVDAAFSFSYFTGLIDALASGKKRSAKALLTQEQIIPGLGNTIAQDILFRAGLHPKHPITALTTAQRRQLFDAIVGTVNAAIDAGGRADEVDLFGRPGRYVRLMDNSRVGQPCPQCGTAIQKMQYLGGACYFCPTCHLHAKPLPGRVHPKPQTQLVW